MELDALAFAVATDGITAHELEVAGFARELSTRTTITRMLLDLLADRTAPSVVRERAFGRLLEISARPQLVECDLEPCRFESAAA